MCNENENAVKIFYDVYEADFLILFLYLNYLERDKATCL